MRFRLFTSHAPPSALGTKPASVLIGIITLCHGFDLCSKKSTCPCALRTQSSVSVCPIKSVMHDIVSSRLLRSPGGPSKNHSSSFDGEVKSCHITDLTFRYKNAEFFLGSTPKVAEWFRSPSFRFLQFSCPVTVNTAMLFTCLEGYIRSKAQQRHSIFIRIDSSLNSRQYTV